MGRLAAAALLAVAIIGSSGVGALAAAGDWPTYHRSGARDGNDTVSSPFNSIQQQWMSATLDGHIYAEPLVVGNQVIVATENNSIYSLDATTGSPTWAAAPHFGTPVTVSGNSKFGGCGNVSPLGITGTPVVDTAAGVIYAVAFVHTSTTDTYQLVAVNLGDGSQKFPPIPITPSGFNQYRQQQRGALALANGNVYIPFGGYDGDCSIYHGDVISFKADGSSTTPTVFNDQPQPPCAATTANRAGIWAASGPAVDASGNLYVATGNGTSTSSYDCGDSVFKLSPTLGYLDSWAPTQWATLNNLDTDVGSVGPAIVGTSSNLIFQSGKNGWGYLLNTGGLSSNANHIGGQAFSAPVCNAALASPTDPTAANDQVFGGVAYADPNIYVPCPEGIKALTLGAGPSFSALWSSAGFSPGPPVVSGGVVWAIDVNAGVLYGLNPADGTTKFTANLGGQTHFSTPAAGMGRVFVADGASGDVIRAFGQGGGQYHPLTPSRIYDSRSAGAGGPLAAGTSRDIQVTGKGGVPTTGVLAAVVNVTVTNGTAGSFLTVYPTGYQRPLASNLNWTAGKTVTNLVEVALGYAGQVTVFNAAGNADVILDVAGWVNVPSGSAGPDGLYNPLAPSRILDTRNGTGGISQPLGPGATITIQVTGRGGVPASGVEAVILNVTATNPTAPSYLTVFPAGSSAPLASNLNYVPGQTTPNRVVVALGTGGMVSLYNAAGKVDVIADVGAWFTDTTAGGTGSSFTPLTPTRLLDTRNGTGGYSSPLGPNQSIALTVADAGGVPAMTASIPPKAVVLNVTVTSPTGASFLTVWADGTTRPGTSDLNYVAGQTVPNLVVVQLGANGKLDIYNAAGSAHVIVDVLGWYG